jgi:hypothetical protein
MNTELTIKKTTISIGEIKNTYFQVIESKNESPISKRYKSKKSAENFIKRVAAGDTTLKDKYLNNYLLINAY